jgi:hypothetical protein
MLNVLLAFLNKIEETTNMIAANKKSNDPFMDLSVDITIFTT